MYLLYAIAPRLFGSIPEEWDTLYFLKCFKLDSNYCWNETLLIKILIETNLQEIIYK